MLIPFAVVQGKTTSSCSPARLANPMKARKERRGRIASSAAWLPDWRAIAEGAVLSSPGQDKPAHDDRFCSQGELGLVPQHDERIERHGALAHRQCDQGVDVDALNPLA